jgi:hypothetical protein
VENTVMSTSRLFAAAALALTIGVPAPRAQQLPTSTSPAAPVQDCSVVESEGPPGGAAPNAFGLIFAGETENRRVSAIVARAGTGPIQSVDLRPLRRAGVSYGTALSTDAAGGGAPSEAAFTLATVEAAGTVLLEVWRWWGSSAGPAVRQPPVYAWARLRCGP